MDDLRHDEVEELLGAYALDAVDDAERAAVESHLATCPRCRAEVDGHRAVAEFLASTGAPAPDQLWDRIADAIGGESPPPMRLVVDHGDPPTASVAARPRARRWNRALLGAAAAVVAVALVGLGAALGGRGGDGGSDVADIEIAALAAFRSPEARTGDLVDDQGRPLARVAVLPGGEGYILADALPDLDDRIYQLWASDGTTVVSVGVMGEAPGIMRFNADDDHVALMISEEDRPATEPTSEAVVFGELS